MPSAPTTTSALQEASAASKPRSQTKASPVTRVHWELNVEVTRTYQSVPGVNWEASSTNPSEPTRCEANWKLLVVGGEPCLRYTSASPAATFEASRHTRVMGACGVT